MEKKYSFRKTMDKVIPKAFLVMIAGLIAVFKDDPAWLALMPILLALHDYAKHRNIGKK